MVTVIVGAAPERASKDTRTFRTVTRDLLALREWLLAKGVTHVALEGTGIYWRPVYEVLEDACEMILGNADGWRNWPPWADRQELRAARKLMESRTAEHNRRLKLLETANIKLASAASNVFGVSCRLMLQALLDGVATPSAMAALAQGRLRNKVADPNPS